MTNNGKKKKKKLNQRQQLTAEELVAGMRGNRNRMPTLGSEYFRKKKKR